MSLTWKSLAGMDRMRSFSTKLTIWTWRASTVSRAEVVQRLVNTDIKHPTMINVTRGAEVSKKLL